MVSFPAHGSASFRIEGRLLLADIDGPWNLELIQQYHHGMRPLIEQLAKDGPWALVIVIHRAAACPPDALELIRQGAIAQSQTSRRVGAAYVIAPEVPGYRVMDRFWRRIYAGVHPFEIFEALDAATAWASEKVAAAGRQEAPGSCPEQASISPAKDK